MTLLGLTLGKLLALFFALGGVVTLLYILRLRRRRINVPFAKLWSRVLKEKESTSLFRRLKRILSLLLQLLFLFLLTAALGDPRLSSEVLAGRHIILLLDTSASMKALDGGSGTRLATAVTASKEIIRGLGGADVMMIVRMDSQVTPLTAFLSDEKALLKALDDLEAVDTRADLARALTFCADALRERKNPLLILVGDGAYPKRLLQGVRWSPSKSGIAPGPQRAEKPPLKTAEKKLPPSQPRQKKERRAEQGSGKTTTKKRTRRQANLLPGELLDEINLQGLDVRFVPVGRLSDNVGIIAFNARRYARNKLSFEMFLEVKNYKDTALEVDLQLYSDGQLIQVERLRLKAHERARYTCDPDEPAPSRKAWCGLAAVGELLEARLVPLAQAGAAPPTLDPFPLDDRAYALLPPRVKQRVLLVTPGNFYLEGAMLLDENIELSTIRPPQYSTTRAAQADAIVFDGFFPTEAPPRSFLLLNPPAGQGPFPQGKRLTTPLITEQDTKHPVMRWITLKDVNISHTVSFLPGPTISALVSSFRQAIMVARQEEGRKQVAFGFDIKLSDLPLRVSFPLLVINCLDWFSGDSERLIASYRSGETLSVPLPQTVRTTRAAPTHALVVEPDGHELKIAPQGLLINFWAPLVGTYKIVYGEQRLLLAANLADEEESDIRPQTQLVMGSRRLSAPTGFGISLRREVWIYFLLAAFALALLEWLTYNRRITV